MTADWNEIDVDAKAWIKEAGAQISSSFNTILHIQEKSNQYDLVTNIDSEIEEFLKRKIEKKYPKHKILAEEGTGHNLSDLKGIVWIIDPIDGTLNFIHQQRNFAISIGVYEDGIGKIGIIYDVVHDEMYHAISGEGAYLNKQKLRKLEERKLEESLIAINASWFVENKQINENSLFNVVKKARGTRSFGSAAIEIASVAAGRIDAYISLNLSPWDFAGGVVLVNEVAGQITDIKGDPIDVNKKTTFIVAKPGLHNEIIDILNHK